MLAAIVLIAYAAMLDKAEEGCEPIACPRFCQSR